MFNPVTPLAGINNMWRVAVKHGSVSKIEI